uniref:Uncharacterized protein n=1 Tax=Cacopsylla melanoneura TaxID=428564 RepID=A0A8D8ZMD3_9HEMI
MYDDMDSSTKYVTFRKTDDRIRKHKSALKRKNEHAPQKKIIGINLPFTKIKSSRFSTRHLEKKNPENEILSFLFYPGTFCRTSFTRYSFSECAKSLYPLLISSPFPQSAI